MHRNCVAQRFARQQNRRVTRDVRRYFFNGEGGRRLNQKLRGVFITGDRRICGAIQVGIITDRHREPRKIGRRLIEYIVAVSNNWREIDLEFKKQAVAKIAKAEVSYVEQPRTGSTAIRICIRTVGINNRRNDIERTRLKGRHRIEAVQFVNNAKSVQRRVARVLNSQAIANRVTRGCHRSRVFAGRDIQCVLLEYQYRIENQDRVGILVVERVYRAVCDDFCVSSCIVKVSEVGHIDAEPFRGASDVDQVRVLLTVDIQHAGIAHDQALIDAYRANAVQNRNGQGAVRVAQVCCREIGTLDEHRRYRGSAVRFEHLCYQLCRGRVTHAAVHLVGQQVIDRQVVSRRIANVLHIERERTGHAERQLQWPGFLERKLIRTDNCHWL